MLQTLIKTGLGIISQELGSLANIGPGMQYVSILRGQLLPEGFDSTHPFEIMDHMFQRYRLVVAQVDHVIDRGFTCEFQSGHNAGNGIVYIGIVAAAGPIAIHGKRPPGLKQGGKFVDGQIRSLARTEHGEEPEAEDGYSP